MSKMAELDAKLRDAGIDPEGVALAEAEAYRVEQTGRGRPLTLMEAAVEMIENIRYAETARKDFERHIYAECDKEDREVHTERQGKDPEVEYYTYRGLEFIGKRERPGDFPLDVFNDTETGATFIREPMESVEDLARRVRGKKLHGAVHTVV